MENKEYRKNLKVMIVDDAEFSRQTISAILEEEGFSVVSMAASATEAVSKLNQQEINLFIIDVVMPQTSGIELAKLITDRIANPNMILISSLAHESILIECITAGAKDFIRKPFEKIQLIDSVDKVALSLFGDKN